MAVVTFMIFSLSPPPPSPPQCHPYKSLSPPPRHHPHPPLLLSATEEGSPHRAGSWPRQHDTGLQRYLEYVGEVPEVEDVMKLNGRGKERCSDFLVQGCYGREAHRF